MSGPRPISTCSGQDWLDQQISKAVLGQTSTTDAVVGGLGSGKEHREVQKDIETADARALATILNRDLIRPWMDLSSAGPDLSPDQDRASGARGLKSMSDALGTLVPLGLRVGMSEVRDKFGFSGACRGRRNPRSDPPRHLQRTL